MGNDLARADTEMVECFLQKTADVFGRRLTEMSDLQLDQTNEGHSGTEIQAQDGFSQDYVFQANATHTNTDQRYVDGLHGFGYRDGRGIVGLGGVHPSSPVDDVDNSSADLNPQGEGVLGVGGDIYQPGQTAGMGVRGIGGQGNLRVRGAIGVYGKGGFPRGHGLLGVGGGEESTGVLGFSEQGGRGATFGAGVVPDVADVNHELRDSRDDVVSAEGIAQLRLVPSKELRPPAVGRIGDLFACSENGTNVGLFLCVVSSMGEDTSPSRPAQWAPIQLGAWVTGG